MIRYFPLGICIHQIRGIGLMRAKLPSLFIIGLSAIVLISCLQPSREAGSAVGGGGGGGGAQATDLQTAALTYESFVKPLFAQHCISCHSAAGRILPLLDTYDDVVDFADINLETMEGVGSPMPPGRLLDDATVQRYRDWYEDGTPQ